MNRPAVPPLPNSTDASLARSAIDHFVLSRLRAADLQPAPQAAPRDLIRRAYLDLVGIPPTPAAVQAFLVDPSPDAFARIVDQLLASPRYGERWGRHWLDVARYSDGFGAFQDSAARPGAYFYRDWVIRALNADMPYDEFVRMQITGDLLAPDEHATALGFFAVGPTYQSDGANPFGEAEARAETLEDRVDTLCRGFLGLTAGCARCHDHKFDPIPTLDYYSIAGVFNNTKNVDLPAVSPAVVNRYESGQVAIREADARYNEWVAASKSAFSERLLAEAPRYVRDALHVLVRRSHREIVETAIVARDKGLVPEVLARWMAYLDNPTHRGKIAALDKWYAQRENLSETLSDEVADEVANAFSAHAKPLLGDPKALRPNRLKSELEGQAEDGFIAAAEKLRKELVPLFRFKKLPEEWLLVTEKQQVEDLRAEKKRARKAAPKRYPVFHALAESGDVNMRVALRGSLLQPGETAPRRFFQLLSRDVPPPFTEGSGRRGLAEAVANAKNPLTARVFVNRVWLHHFGKALVRTPSNFGSLGEPPTHPRLLDWLASEFVSDSWSIKALHRRILLSATYAMSSAHVNSNYEQDPDNRLLWRMNPRRLDVEIWRDTLLAVAGTLETTIGGPPQQELVGNRRRTVYAAVSRIGDRFRPDEFLRLFDFPSARATNAKRIQSVVPQQYLFMMNSEFMLEVAKALAARLEQAHPNEVERIEYASSTHTLFFTKEPRMRRRSNSAAHSSRRRGKAVL